MHGFRYENIVYFLNGLPDFLKAKIEFSNSVNSLNMATKQFVNIHDNHQNYFCNIDETKN